MWDVKSPRKLTPRFAMTEHGGGSKLILMGSGEL